MLLAVVYSNYTGVLLFEIKLLPCYAQSVQMCFMIALVLVVTAEVYNVPLPTPVLHVSLLLDFIDELYWCALS